MRLRPLERADAPALSRLLGNGAGFLPAPPPKGLEALPGIVAEEGEDRRLVGGVLLSPVERGRFEVAAFALEPSFRGMGLETQLVLSAEILVERLRGRRLEVWVTSDAARGGEDPEQTWLRGFWKERGYRLREFLADRFGRGRPGDLLSRTLEFEGEKRNP